MKCTRSIYLAPPARSTVQVARLPKTALVEIEVIAGSNLFHIALPIGAPSRTS